MAELDHSQVPEYPKLLSLEGHGYLVAGAGQGMGRQTAHALAQAGARVLVIDVNPEAAEHVAREIGGVPLVTDMTTREGVELALQRAKEEFGRLDGIVDIIGMARFRDLSETTDEDWDWAERMNLRHAFLLAQLGGQALAEQGGGTIVYIASTSGLLGAQHHGAYGVMKAGVISLVRTAAVELGPKGIRINAVAPGVVWTPRMSSTIGPEKGKLFAENAPMQRVAEPRDIASTILYLSSELSSYVTGQVIAIDGGVSAKFPYPIQVLRE
jgi:NAD(P)-dependent dehydrogenase (short-subunit alcohol dehydrogenase family)